MTISIYRKICVTNRHLAQGDFLRQIERVTAAKPTALILREKDLTQEAYEELAVQVLAICREADVACYFHSQPQLAVKLNAQGIHLPLKMAASMSCEDRMRLPCLGISVHSKKEAVEAQKMGAAYIIYGHIFATDCKKGVPPRGLAMLRSICGSVSVPVYAIGGINEENAWQCIDAGAYGVCMMSKYMEL